MEKLCRYQLPLGTGVTGKMIFDTNAFIGFERIYIERQPPDKSTKAPISENAKFPFAHAGRSSKKEMSKI
jgi:hypothetical protein